MADGLGIAMEEIRAKLVLLRRPHPARSSHLSASGDRSVGSPWTPDGGRERGREGPPVASQPASPSPSQLSGGAHYLTYDELPPLTQTVDEKFILDVLKRMEMSKDPDWAEQFSAIDSARRLARFAPNSLSSHLRRLTSLATAHSESLRSVLAKNALRCISELFSAFGKRMDREIDLSLPVVLRRAGDTNAFISEEAENALREICYAGAEARLLQALLASAINRRLEIRVRASWGLAMLAQRLSGHSSGRGRTNPEALQSVADVTVRLLGDASAEVRRAARVTATVLCVCGGPDGCTEGLLASSVIPGIDPDTFDAFDIASPLSPVAEHIRHARPGLPRK